MTIAKSACLARSLFAVALAVSGCGMNVGDTSGLQSTTQDVIYTGFNDLNPGSIDSGSLMRSVLNQYSITTPTLPDPMQLCGPNITASGCDVNGAWENWRTDQSLTADLRGYRESMLKALVKCSVDSTFTLRYANGSASQSGQWGLYPSWKGNRLSGQDKRERISACVLSLLNGNNLSLRLCVIGPGGSPFSDDCQDSTMTVREGGYFGDLFAVNPTAYVVGPNSTTQTSSGRACFANQGTYCCAEDDLSCTHRVVLAGAFAGTNQRCNGFATTPTGRQFCTSFSSNREPGRIYANVFTTFVPSAP